jgi:aryl-alcohol dehydrogenase-like predicted oxidoreductase
MGEQKHAGVQINQVVEEIAKERGISMAQVACAWTLSKPYITAPIVGSTKLENLKDLIDAVNIKLTEDEIKRIDAPYTA